MQEHHNSPAETGDESALLILHSKIHCLFEQGVLDGVAAPGLVLDVIGEDIVVTDCGGGVPFLAVRGINVVAEHPADGLIAVHRQRHRVLVGHRASSPY